MFTLHDRLKTDTVEVTRLKLSRVLLMNDRALPWLILVPERDNITEWHDLLYEDRTALMEEIVLVSKVIQELYNPDKINIGSLGNIVSQLHIHIIGRFRSDRAWPGPLWGTVPITPYSDNEWRAVCEKIRATLVGHLR